VKSLASYNNTENPKPLVSNQEPSTYCLLKNISVVTPYTIAPPSPESKSIITWKIANTTTIVVVEDKYLLWLAVYQLFPPQRSTG
jgi:hypothetical protein